MQTVTSTPSTFPLVPSCPRLSLLSIIPLPSCALFALSSCPLSTLGTPSQKNILPFGHCLNWRRPPTKIYVDIFLAANFPPNQFNREFSAMALLRGAVKRDFLKKVGILSHQVRPRLPTCSYAEVPRKLNFFYKGRFQDFEFCFISMRFEFL